MNTDKNTRKDEAFHLKEPKEHRESIGGSLFAFSAFFVVKYLCPSVSICG